MRRRRVIAALGVAMAAVAGVFALGRRSGSTRGSRAEPKESPFVELVVLLSPWSEAERVEAVLFARALAASALVAITPPPGLARLNLVRGRLNLALLDEAAREYVVGLLQAIYATEPARLRLLGYFPGGSCQGADLHGKSPAELDQLARQQRERARR